MTENEIKNTKEWIEDFIETYALSNQETIEFKKLVVCLEEIQQYRAIGTVAELKTAMKYVSLAKKHGTVGKAIDSCADYSAIGTIEEFKALKEKATPKKLEIEKFWGYDDLMCPNCKSYKIRNPKYCCDCGQKLDWQ